MTRFGAAILLLVSSPAASIPPAVPEAPSTLRFEALGSVSVGMTVRQAERALRSRLTLEFPNDDPPNGCAIAYVKGSDDPLSYMVERGRVTRFDLGGLGVTSPVRTAEGIGLRSSIHDLRRAYGTRAKSHPNFYNEAEPDFEITSADGKSAIIFETVHGRVIRMHAGRLPSAEYVEGCE